MSGDTEVRHNGCSQKSHSSLICYKFSISKLFIIIFFYRMLQCLFCAFYFIVDIRLRTSSMLYLYKSLIRYLNDRKYCFTTLKLNDLHFLHILFYKISILYFHENFIICLREYLHSY